MRRLLFLGLGLALVGGVPAAAGSKSPISDATVIRVVRGDALDVRLASGEVKRVHVLGIRSPEPGACFAPEATAGTRRLVLAKQITLVGETGARRQRFAYVALPGGADLGRLLVQRGLARIDGSRQGFARFLSYVPVQQAAERANRGMWGACATDLEVTLEASPDPVAVGARLTYLVTVKNRGPVAASPAFLELRPPPSGRFVSADSPDGPCRTQSWLGTCSFGVIAERSAVTATFVVEVERPGIASARAVAGFGGCIRSSCGPSPLHDSNRRNNETAALSLVSGTLAPPTPGAPPPPPSVRCSPSYPTVCIPPPPPDLDCAEVPYRNFSAPLDVRDPDPHDLDGNEDGIGCQFDDY